MTRHVILFLAANPHTTNGLRSGEECAAIQRELKMSPNRDDFQFESRWAVSIDELMRHLNELAPSVIHFSGHGDGDGGVMLADEQGQPQPLLPLALRMIVDAAASDARLVVLNACYTTAQAEVLRGCVDCVVGMAGAVGDDAARAFAVRFYGALGNRRSIGNAVDQGVAALAAKQLPEQAIPRCVTRIGVDGYRVFLEPRRDVSPAPVPTYPDAETRALSERLEDARARRDRLRDTGVTTDEIDQEILALRRQLRDGGQLRAGDALGNGRYLLLAPVGHGGFAVVWKAYDRTARRSVAIKVLHPYLASDRQRRERFFRGARVMAELNSPGIVRVLDRRGEDDTFCYFVMELALGGNLRDAVLANRVPASRALALILQVGHALAEAHRRQIVHRDVKPANILLDERGNAKLSDFDLVGMRDTTGGTRTGALGTIVYAAPECLDRPQEATARADVFGLGMTAIFSLLRQDLPMSTFRDPKTTLARLPCPPGVRKVLSRAIEWEPLDRFTDSAALVDALNKELVKASTTSAALDHRRTSALPRVWRLVIVLGVAGNLLVMQGRRSATEPSAIPSPPASSSRDLKTQRPLGSLSTSSTGSCPIGMERVRAGTFRMGSPDGIGMPNEHPAHDVILSAYCIDRTEVTVSAYSDCVQAGSCTRADSGGSCNRSDRPQHPVNCVDWHQASAYCTWHGGRLPTEAEWEYAARGTDGRAYPWGNQPPDAQRLNACGVECSGGISGQRMYQTSDTWSTTAPVASFPDGVSPFAALDMAGNVWEWTADWYGVYSSAAETNPHGPAGGATRVVRGGGWSNYIAGVVRSAYRTGDDPEGRYNVVGFRCVRGD